jgi:hypothetical protein
MGQPGEEGGDYGGPSQNGQGPRCGHYGKVLLPSVIFYSPVKRSRPSTLAPFKREDRTVNLESSMIRVPTHAIENTCATSARLCAYADKSCNWLCTLVVLPGVLSTYPDSMIIPEQLPWCWKNGHHTMHGQLTERKLAAQDSILYAFLYHANIIVQ